MLNKVIISGGGTGGHIYPAIAIANALKEENPNRERGKPSLWGKKLLNIGITWKRFRYERRIK